MNGVDVVETLMWSELQRHSDSPASTLSVRQVQVKQCVFVRVCAGS